MIRIACSCGRVVHVNDRLAGKLIRCPACASVVRVDDPATAIAVDVLPMPAGDQLDVCLPESVPRRRVRLEEGQRGPPFLLGRRVVMASAFLLFLTATATAA